MSVRARHSRDKQQQAMTTLPIAIDTIIVITNRDGCDQRLHCEAPKRSRDEPLYDKVECDNQPQSHKAAFSMNATRALWGRCEYHDDTLPATTIIVKGASIAATQAQQTQPWARRPSKQETLGRLVKFMPYVSCNKRGINNKTYK